MGLQQSRLRGSIVRSIFCLGFVALFAYPAFAVIPWSSNYAESVAKAQQESRPIIIDFTAEWCGWCKRLDEEVYADNSVETALANFVCLKIDVDKQPNVALAYNVQSMPRTIIINTHNEMVGDLNGFAPLGPFLEFLEGVKGDLARETGGTKAPEVTNTAAPTPEVAPVKPTMDSTSAELVEMLGNPDPEVRNEAARVIAEKPDRAQIFVAALASDYLGARIAALEHLKKTGAPDMQFDPWAKKAERDAALAPWREWLEVQTPKS